MAYPTPAQIDSAVPVDGTPSRSLTNAVLRALASGPAAENITDATTVGRSVLTAATAAAARTAIGAVALGTTASTAAAGNHTHGAATSTTAGFMSAADKAKLDALPAGGGGVTPTAAPIITIGDPVDDENVQASFDALIAALKTAGVLT